MVTQQREISNFSDRASGSEQSSVSTEVAELLLDPKSNEFFRENKSASLAGFASDDQFNRKLTDDILSNR